MDGTKLNTQDLDSPHQDISNGGLGFVIASLFFSGN